MLMHIGLLWLPCAATFASIIPTPTPEATPETSEEWGIVFDCGSSGTRSHYFKWPADQPIEGIDEVEGGLKVEPGISQFGAGQGCSAKGATDLVCDQVVVDDDHPACSDGQNRCDGSSECCLDIERYIAPLFLNASGKVPDDVKNKTKLRMRATAGMRLLDASVQDAIWAKLDAAAAASGFDFVPGAYTLSGNYALGEDAYTLSGNYEGLFGWLAVQQVNNWPMPSIGWLDLGGASTQIAFQPTDGVITENSIAAEVLVGPQSPKILEWKNIYSVSYMLSGQDQGQLRIAQYLYHRAVSLSGDLSGEIPHPCFNVGLRKNMTVCEGIALGSSSTCKAPKVDVVFAGTGMYDECSSAIAAAIIHADYQCLQEPCAVAGRYQPEVRDMTFFAGSAFYYTVDGLNLTMDGEGTYTSTNDISDAGRKFCKQEWDSLDADTKKYGDNYCFASAYIPAMLDAYGISRDSKAVVTYAKDVSDEALEWPLGCQIYSNSLYAGSTSECDDEDETDEDGTMLLGSNQPKYLALKALVRNRVSIFRDAVTVRG